MRRTRLSALVGLAAASLVLTACGGGDDEEDKGPEGQEVAGGPTMEQTWPLTGLPVSGDQTASQRHPVMVLKMDNTSSSAPQVGLGDADLVVEELVEGGMTRLAVFYYSTIPGNVGPVRSMRASDIGIVSPSGGAMVTSGAAPVTINRIKGAGIRFFAEGAKGFYRDSSRSAPYNLFTNMKQTATLVQGKAARPEDYLTWGEAKDLPKGQPARSLAANFGNHTTTWTYRAGGYANDNSYAAEGDEFPADTVLVLRVKIGDAGYKDPAGYPVPETQFEGTGQAMLFHGGRVVKGTWSKGALDAPVELSTKAGELKVPAGHVWIELVPAQNGSVTVAR